LFVVAWWARLVTGVLMPLIAVPFVVLAVTDAHVLATGSTEWTGLHWSAVAGGLLVVGVMAAAWRMEPRGEKGDVYRHWVAIATMVMALICALAFTVAGFLDPTTGMPEPVDFAVIAFIVILFCAFVAFVAQTRTTRAEAVARDAESIAEEPVDQPAADEARAAPSRAESGYEPAPSALRTTRSGVEDLDKP
jgi:peptidoglycan/LPS O-acetylase OafA/YrhL